VPERVSFLSATGPTLAGLVDLPEDEVRGWGVFAHGFTLGKGSPAASRICKQLASEGIGMLRFDNLGLVTPRGTGVTGRSRSRSPTLPGRWSS
jgi:predicted alpha/beta-hydrolase family hydrolase